MWISRYCRRICRCCFSNNFDILLLLSHFKFIEPIFWSLKSSFNTRYFEMCVKTLFLLSNNVRFSSSNISFKYMCTDVFWCLLVCFDLAVVKNRKNYLPWKWNIKTFATLTLYAYGNPADRIELNWYKIFSKILLKNR